MVAFDVGETLIDETRIWERWADRLRVTRLTFLGVLGAIVAAGRPHVEVFETFRPGFQLASELEAWAKDDPDGLRERFDEEDLYADVRDAFAALGDRDLRVIIAANQPPAARAALEAMDLGVDTILISDELGIAKPDPRFFDAVAQAAGVRPNRLAYVGDRVDNDVLPAKRAGMKAVLVRRGPWGHLQARWPDAACADAVVGSLAELPDVLGGPPR